jgi:cell division protease FtsH
MGSLHRARIRTNLQLFFPTKVKLAPEVDLRAIAAQTPGFAGADLANVINEAALLAARAGKEAVEMPDLREAIDRMVAGLEKKNRVINAQEKEVVAFHEAGHALVAASLPGTDPVHKISIVPRGIAALGYTQQQPTEDRYLLRKSERCIIVSVSCSAAA